MTNQVAKKSLPAFLVLTIICLVAALALAATNAITKGPIAEHAMAAQREAFGAVMAADEYAEMTIPEGSGISALVEAKKDGQTIGYCVVASTGGYAGPVAVTLGVGTDGIVTGAKIGDTSFAETSGFGSRWLAENQTEQFVGISLKDGGAIEALSGATVTSTAVLNASNTAMAAVNGILGIERTEPVLVFGVAEKKPVEQMALTGDIHEGSAKGFASDVKVQLTKDASGAITGLAIESSGETAGFGTRCMEDPTFAEQFVGKTAPFAIGENIDALAGATVTSTAVVNAVNAAVESPANPDAVPFGSGAEEEPAVEVSAEPLPEGAMTASAKGLLSDVKVTITKNADGTIATIVVDASGETAAIATPCTEEAFLSQFIGKAGPFEGAEVVTGATFTSNAVINALNSMFPTQDMSTGAEEAPVATEQTASAKGLLSDVKVTITKNEDGTIATIVVDASGETAAIATPCTEEAFLSQFIGKAGPFEGAEVVTGATFTSNAVINALNSMFPAAPAGEEKIGKAQGFQSEVTVTLTVDAGVITGIKVNSADETTGFGTRCGEDEAFLNQFIGKKATPDLGEGIEALSGATVTSNAVIEAANAAIGVAQEVVEIPAAAEQTASAKGLLSDVKVTITKNEDGTIATIVVDASGETAAIATPCTEEAFLSQFIGKAGPFEGAEVVTGATFTSNAVINALNSMFPAEEAPAAEAAAEQTASAKGLLSDVKVTITKNEDGTIATIVVDASGETEAIAKPCTEEAFLSQFVGKAGPFEGVEVVAGATFTSNAVINALNSMFPAAPVGEEMIGKAQGFQSEVTVTLTVDAGVITGIKVNSADETTGFGTRCGEDEAFLNQFIGKKATPDLGEGIEALSGATVTSNAVIEAANAAIGVAQEVVEIPATEELTASAKGLLSDVKVTITKNADGTIATIVVDASGETEAIAKPCTEEAFLSQFVGKAGPFEGVEVVAGATFTSNAVINALNSMFPAQDMSTGAEEAPVATEQTASAKGLLSDVKVTITKNADGTIATIVVDASGETEAIAKPCTEEAFLSQFVGKAGPFEGAEVVAGATFTSNAVINALNSMFPAQDMSTGTEEAPVAEEQTASAKGLLSDVKVTITKNAEGTIATIVVDASGETEAIAKPCTEEAFLSQFVGKAGPFEGVEVVAGATFTSNAVINALNSMFAK